MQAVILGDDLRTVTVEECFSPPPSPPPSGFATIRVLAAALNHRDCWIRKGLYPALQPRSVLGADCCGVVEEINSNDPSERALVGSRVIVCPTVGWERGRVPPPSQFGILGMLPLPGCLAERVCVPFNLIFSAPSHLSHEEAAALPLAGLTAFRAVFTKGEVKEGDNVLITGIGGGVALFALQFCVAAGANVWVTSSSTKKIEKAVSLGARGGVNYKNKRWVKELSELANDRMHTVIDGAGGDGINHLFRLLHIGGIIVSYGTTAGDVHAVNLARLFLKNGELRGSTMGSTEEFKHMLEFVSNHSLSPVISSVRPLSATVEAMDEMDAGGQFGKLVLTTSVRSSL